MDTPAQTSRYFFQIRRSDDEILDLEGSLHSDLAAAVAEMAAGVRDMLGHDLIEGRSLDLRSRIDAELDGVVVATLAFKDAITILA